MLTATERIMILNRWEPVCNPDSTVKRWCRGRETMTPDEADAHVSKLIGLQIRQRRLERNNVKLRGEKLAYR